MEAPLACPSQARLTCSLSRVLSGESLSQMGADSLGQVQDVLEILPPLQLIRVSQLSWQHWSQVEQGAQSGRPARAREHETGSLSRGLDRIDVGACLLHPCSSPGSQ